MSKFFMCIWGWMRRIWRWIQGNDKVLKTIILFILIAFSFSALVLCYLHFQASPGNNIGTQNASSASSVPVGFTTNDFLHMAQTISFCLAILTGAAAAAIGYRAHRIKEVDATNRRFNEAVRSMCNCDSQFVCIEGIYALERLAFNAPNEKERQRVMEVLCTWLRDERRLDKFISEDKNQIYEYLNEQSKAALNVIIRIKKKYKEVAIDLSRTDFLRINLENVYLEGSDFLNTYFWEISFLGGYLADVKFREAYLKGANFEDAHLEGTNFEGARIEDANFKGAHLGNASFWHALFEGANFNDAHLEGANFEAASSIHAGICEESECVYFIGAHLECAKFGGAHLERANFNDAHLEGADFGHANIYKKTEFENAIIDNHTILGDITKYYTIDKSNPKKWRLRSKPAEGYTDEDVLEDLIQKENT
ncbi:MAG TPA: hypothetical protein DEQ02_04170 [Ruminococcaceae bacterium]|nr:hypothetical protein [Oscillospiraceae bacterium]